MWTGGGRVKNVIFLVDVINGWPLILLRRVINDSLIIIIIIYVSVKSLK